MGVQNKIKLRLEKGQEMYGTMKIRATGYTQYGVQSRQGGSRVLHRDCLAPGGAPRRNGHFKCLGESSGSLAPLVGGCGELACQESESPISQ